VRCLGGGGGIESWFLFSSALALSLKSINEELDIQV